MGGLLMLWRCRRRHPMRGVIDIDEASQVAVVIDKRPFRVSRSLVPEDIDITEAVLGPDVEFGPVPWRCSQGLPFARVKHGFTFQSSGAVFRKAPPLSISLHGLGHSLYRSETGARLRLIYPSNAISSQPAPVGRLWHSPLLWGRIPIIRVCICDELSPHLGLRA